LAVDNSKAGSKKINSWQLKIKKVAVKMLDLAVSYFFK
jgi:hypothetical protein